MIDVWNRVLSRLKLETILCKEFTSVSCRDDPPSFPCTFVNQIGNEVAMNDLVNEENAVNSTIELHVYSNKSLNEARNIIAQENDIMRKMGYRRIFGPQQVDNISANGVYRIIARYRRIIGSGEIESITTRE